jgi:hypothetical protein
MSSSGGAICCLLLCCLAHVGSAQPALASDLDLAAFDGRVTTCSDTFVEYNDTCTCDSGQTWQNSSCEQCEPGYFKEQPGLHECSGCPLLTTSFEGAAQADDCLCVAGYHNTSGACEPCAGGNYKSFVGNNTCVACPAHSDTLGTGSDELEDCLCVAGYVVGAETCSPCPQHMYRSLIGDVCLSCAVGSGTHGPGSTSCECEAGYTPGSEGVCTVCAAGEYKIARSMDSCTLCPQHSSSLPAATVLANCTCTAGFEKRPPSSDNDTCVACEANHYCPGADSKLQCPGNSTSSAGSAAPTACTCLPGFFRADSRCVECSENHFCAYNTRSPCPANSSSVVLSFSIDNCTCVPGFRETG